MKKSLPLLLFHVFLPLLAGGAVYVLFRPAHLPILRLATWLDPTETVETLRIWAQTWKPCLPGWTIYSLPNGLWVYSLTLFFWLVWQNKPERVRWHLAAWTMAISAEALQGVHVLTGTFSWLDMAFILGGAIAGWLVGKTMLVSRFNPGGAIVAGAEMTQHTGGDCHRHFLSSSKLSSK